MPEQQNIEWKQSWRDEYLQWISGFANANGGVLYIGKDDSGNVVGVDKYSKLMEDLPNKIMNTTGLACNINLHNKDNKYFIEIVVESMKSPVSYRGKFYFRSGSTNQLLNGISLEDFLFKKSNLTWDGLTIEEATIDDIDENAIKYFKRKAIETGRIPSLKDSTDTETILERLDLIDGNGKYTRACVVLFGKNPVKFFKSTYLKIGKFGDSYTKLLHQDVIECNAFEMADRAIEILDTKYLIRNVKYEGISRVEIPDYPFDAIRELLFNAIVHQRQGVMPITIRVFNDRIVISSFGMLPEGLTPEDLKKPHGSFPRNKLMANVFYKGGHIETWGRGTLKVIEECEKYGLPEPLIEEMSGGVWVTLFKKRTNPEFLATLPLNERQLKSIEYLKNNSNITSKIYQELFDTSYRTAIRDLNGLLETEIIKKVGDNKGAKYELR